MTTDNEHKRTEPEHAAFERISDAMRRMRVLTGRRIIGRQALKRIGNGIELSHLDVISVVRRFRDVTIGMVADEMRIDPSRASRIVGELVSQGVLERCAAQNDARRTILELTAAGWKIVAAAEETKREMIHEALGGWPEEDIEHFARLYQAFTIGLENCLSDVDDSPSTSP